MVSRCRRIYVFERKTAERVLSAVRTDRCRMLVHAK